MSIVKLLTPKRARKQDRRENAVYAVRQLTAIRTTIDGFKLEGETDAMCVKRIVGEWKELNEIYNLPTQRARTEATIETELDDWRKFATYALEGQPAAVLRAMMAQVVKHYGEAAERSVFYAALSAAYELAYEAESGADDDESGLPNFAIL